MQPLLEGVLLFEESEDYVYVLSMDRPSVLADSQPSRSVASVPSDNYMGGFLLADGKEPDAMRPQRLDTIKAIAHGTPNLSSL